MNTKKKSIIVHLPINPNDPEFKSNHIQSMDISNKLTPQEFNYNYLLCEDSSNLSSYSQNNTTKQELEDDVIKKINENKQFQMPLMRDYQNLNKEKRRPDKTDIYCWWDCNPFSGKPIGIPYCKKQGTYYLDGNFCSPECAAAHLFSQPISNSEKFKRYELLHEYINKIGHSKTERYKRIQLAPTKKVLKQYGGYISIKDFRKGLNNYNTKINTISPPVISVIPTMEVENRNSIFVNHNNIFIPIDDEKVKNAKKELTLKRNKPLPNNVNTLQKVMNLTFSKKTSKNKTF
jgi:hypothetical protein